MKNNLTNSCKDCPFKKTSLNGWLGGLSAKETSELVLGEANFACHLTRHKKAEEMSRCKGSQIFLLNNCKMPKFNEDLIDAVAKTRAENHNRGEYLGFDFIKHHESFLVKKINQE